MVDTRMRVQHPRTDQARPEPVQAPQENLRHQRRIKRLQRLKDARPEVKMVNVVLVDERHRPVLKHQPSGIGFKDSGGAVWPDDNFTHRRLRDGSVKLADEKPEAKPEAKSRN